MGLRKFSILALFGSFLGPHECLKSYIGPSGDTANPSGVPNGPRLTKHDPLLCILLLPGIGSFLGPQKGPFWGQKGAVRAKTRPFGVPGGPKNQYQAKVVKYIIMGHVWSVWGL